MATKIEHEEFLEAVENNSGWCTGCKAFTRGETEPDADGYDCPDCEAPNVVGAEAALLQGFIEPE